MPYSKHCAFGGSIGVMLTSNKGLGWGHRKIVDLAETLPSETFEYIEESEQKSFAKYE